MRAGQHRLLAGAIGGWAATRLVAGWPWRRAAVEVVGKAAAGALLPAAPTTMLNPAALEWATSAPQIMFAPRHDADSARAVAPVSIVRSDERRQEQEAPRRTAMAVQDGQPRTISAARQVDLAPLPPPSTRQPARSGRWFGSAYLFVRTGDGDAALASAGTLGGSQAGMRIGYALDAGRRLAAVGRAYRPLGGRGSEAAVGIDWRPFEGSALRLSGERRVGLDRAGRDAWSIYAAHGFYLERGGIVLDGYGQAGVVGARRRDLFADGALRAGRRVRVAGLELVAGAGMWGAAQPGVSRLDVGPRAAATLPVADRSIVVALESRVRVAGKARPDTGVALTLGSDF